MFKESWEHGLDAGGRGIASRGPADGACGASRVLTPGSHPCGERIGGQREGATGTGQGKTDGGGIHVHGGMRQTGKDYSDTIGVR
jgi:hypothetical protein